MNAFPMILACYVKQDNYPLPYDGPLQLIRQRRVCRLCGGASLFESSPCVLCQLNRGRQVRCGAADFEYMGAA